MDTPQSNETAVKAADPVSVVPAETPKINDTSASPVSEPSIFHRASASVMAALAARPRLSRVTVLAASIAISAALGSVVGALAAAAFVRPVAEPVAVPTMIAHADKNAIAKLTAEIASLKASVDSMAKNSNAQLARINERVERDEKAQSEPAVKIARLTDAVEKLERKTASTAAAGEPEITGSIVPKQQDKPSIVSGWVIREIFDGAAMVESRHGLYEAVPGANLPGLGRVETIRRQNGRWVVVTPKGIIVSAR